MYKDKIVFFENECNCSNEVKNKCDENEGGILEENEVFTLNNNELNLLDENKDEQYIFVENKDEKEEIILDNNKQYLIDKNCVVNEDKEVD